MNFIKNWRTTITGAAALIVSILTGAGKIPVETGTTITGIVTAILGVLAKDGSN